jgi:crotonobetainyl-CoA:carnitine CoA-transferase CaiB-like acyl-CoA transferase
MNMAQAWQPLAGVRVVDFSMFVPGPFAAAIFADLGAEVLKVEPPAGDPCRGYLPLQFRSGNRNKRSLALDLKQEGSKEVVARLAAQADIVIEGFRPGVAERLGIDYETLAQSNARLIYCALSGYGGSGPWRERPGHDLNYLAAGGGLAFPGQWLGVPTRSSLPVADMAGGSCAAIALLAALAERNRSGRGARLDLSLFEAGFFWAAMRHGLAPGGDPRAHLFPVNDVFECADGARLTLGILEQHFWRKFTRCVPGFEGEEYSSDAKRRANGDVLSRKLSDTMKSKPSAEWIALLEANDVPVDRCLTPAEAAALPQIRARGTVARAEGEDFAAFPGWADGRRGASLRRGVPRAGEHSREVLVELGFDDAEIADLVRSGAVKAH